MKNNNKLLIIIGIIVMNVLVVYMSVQAFMGQTSDFEANLQQAREYANANLCQKSIEAYNQALFYEDSMDVRIEMLEVYDKAIQIGEYKKSNSLFLKVSELTELYPKAPKAYEAACAFMVKYEKYDTCAELLMKADDLYVTSEELNKILAQVRYQYKLTHTMYSEITSYYNNSYNSITNDIYTMLDGELTEIGGGNFNYASGFSENYAFVRLGTTDSNFTSFVIDKKGVRQCYLDGVTESSGVGRGNDKEGNVVLLLAGKKGNTYQYYNMKGEAVFGNYVFAGRFRNNVAAVQETAGAWKLIDTAGNPIVDTVFEDVILNEFDECAPKGYIWAKTGGKYYLYDMHGKQIGNFSCDYARAFIDDVTAFRSGELWGFVNGKGEVVIEPQYEDAKAFSCGIAGVKIQGGWKFVDQTNAVAIDGMYEDAGYLSSNGKCFVKNNGKWAVLNMYYIAD